jgi:hypothetical protein
MSGPPIDIEAEELWRNICRTDEPNARYYEVVDFPRNDRDTGKPLGELAIWPLKDNEITQAKAEATKYARALIKEKKETFEAHEYIEGYQQVFSDACATEMVWRFCRNVKDRSVAAFPTAAACRLHLSGDEKAVLCNAYALVQVKFGPIVSGMTVEDYDAWIQRLAEGGSATPLAFLTWEQRTELLMHSASLLYALQKGNSSAGKPPDAPT